MHIFYRGTNDGIFWLRCDFNQSDAMTRWEKSQHTNRTTPMGLSLLQNEHGLVLLACLPHSHYPLINCALKASYIGWLPFLPFNDGADIPHTDPSLFMWENRLYYAIYKSDNTLDFFRYQPSEYPQSKGYLRPTFEHFRTVDFDFAPSISVASRNNFIWIAYQKRDGSVWVTRFTRRFQRADLPTNITALPRSDPIVYCFKDRVYLAYSRRD